jgi:hypothetical protein
MIEVSCKKLRRNTQNTYGDCDFTVGGNERGCCKSDEEDLGEHNCGDWVV